MLKQSSDELRLFKLLYTKSTTTISITLSLSHQPKFTFSFRTSCTSFCPRQIPEVVNPYFNGAKLTQKLASRIRISHESLNEKISSPYSPRPRWYLHSINKLEHMRVYKSGFCVCLKFHSPPTYISNSNQQNLDLTSKLLEASTPEENSTGSNCFLETKILLCT